ncbi:MAG: hypothetical protein CHACPFDD_00609 [Phycisphaerae bacterium]|nr:hypothetical protein [Phycisphaerae bacterium]
MPLDPIRGSPWRTLRDTMSTSSRDEEFAMTQTAVERGNTKTYQDKLLGLLGSREPLDVLAETPAVIARLVAMHPADTLRKRPFPGKWTPLEIIGHLCDAEWVYGYRTRLIACEERPAITSMDQDLWVAGQRYNEYDPRELAETFAGLRRANLALFRRLSQADLKRAGLHAERGEEPLELMRKMHAGHDLSHIDQITRYVAATRGA